MISAGRIAKNYVKAYPTFIGYIFDYSRAYPSLFVPHKIYERRLECA